MFGPALFLRGGNALARGGTQDTPFARRGGCRCGCRCCGRGCRNAGDFLPELLANVFYLALNLRGFFLEMMKRVFEDTRILDRFRNWHEFSLRHYIMKIVFS